MRKYILNSAKGKKLLTEMLEKKNINNVNDIILESAINKLDDNSVTKIMDKLVNENKIHDIEFYSNFLKKQFGENSNIYKNAITSYLDSLKNYFGEDSDIYKDAVKTLTTAREKANKKESNQSLNESKTVDIDTLLEYAKKLFGEDSDIYKDVVKTLTKGREKANKNESNQSLNEGYDDVSMDYIKNKPKLSSYDNDKLVSVRKELDGYTLLHFGLDDTNPYTKNEVKAFDNQDGTEIAKSSYMYVDGELKCTIDVRGDKRRKGIASSIYKWIEEITGDEIQPDNPSKLAQKFWNQPNRPFGSNKK